MEEKKVTKISLSTFFLIISAIIIVVMGYFIFRLYTQKTDSEKYANELNTKIINLEKTINDVQNVITNTTSTNTKEPTKTTSTQLPETKKTYSYNDIKGLYSFTKELKYDAATFDVGYTLCLYENGTYEYQFGLRSMNSLIGNYRIENDMIILNKMFRGGSDIALGTTSGEIKLRINNDGSITDSNNLIDENIKASELNVDFSNVTLKKESISEEQEYLKYFPSIMTHINSSVSGNAVYNGN